MIWPTPSYKVFHPNGTVTEFRYCSCDYCHFGSPYGMWLRRKEETK